MAKVQKRSLNKKWLVLAAVLAFIGSAAAAAFYFIPYASNETQRYFSTGQPIIYNGRTSGEAEFVDGQPYIPLNVILEHAPDSLYIEGNSVIAASGARVWRAVAGEPGFSVNGKESARQHAVILARGESLLAEASWLEEALNLDIRILPESRAVFIADKRYSYKEAFIAGKEAKKAELRLRIAPGLRNAYVGLVSDREKVRVEKEETDYFFVRKADGTAGYVKKSFVKPGREVRPCLNKREELPEMPPLKKPIHLTWEAVYKQNPDPASLPKMDGVNIVSPTWFSLADESGSVKSLASREYVDWAHRKDMKVWALFSNSFNPDLTKAALSSFSTRDSIIRQLMEHVRNYNLDGLNIDIENVYEEDGPLVTQFVRELSAHLHAEKKAVSVDITFIASGNWSAFYEREKLAEIADYLIVMAYDEHWGSSQTAGSVASLPWVESNLANLLNEVPSDKLILGVPLFTRLWKEERTAGAAKVSSKALSMDQAEKWMAERNLKPEPDQTSGQNYIEHTESGATYKMWLEDNESLRKRAKIARDHNLAGIASWSRYFANDSAWASLTSTLSAARQE